MKNIHILPTDKPSRIYMNLGQLFLEQEYSISKGESLNHNIYITSDEEIKEGDWVLLNYPKGVEIDKALPSKLENSFHNADFWIAENKIHNCNHKKIILTTDQDLIKDGVQAIDDEFLEWFFKNRNYEEVEVIPLRKSSGWYDEKNVWHWDFLAYKIIIPSEEVVSEYDVMPNIVYGENVGERIKIKAKIISKKEPKKEPKKETLEEAAERIAHNFEEPSFKAGVVYGIIEGAKWQQERMYSEEEVLEHLNHLIMMPSSKLDKFTDDEEMVTMKWFEQFKKK